MRNDPTPIEGKGAEMIPERGLPFDDDDAEQENPDFEFQNFAEPESIEDILEQVPDEISQEGFNHLTTTSNNGVSQLTDTLHTPEKLLDIEEIRGREMELAEDAHTPQPDFEDELDKDFATARTPISLPSAVREAIMLESGAGIINNESLANEQSGIDENASISTASRGEDVSTTQGNTLSPQESAKTKTIVIQKSTGEASLFSKESFELPGSITSQEETKVPEAIGDLKAAKKMMDLLVTNKTVESLWKRADDLQADVIENIEDLNVARALLEHIRSARTRLLEKKDNYEEAERELNEVEFRLSYNHRSRQWQGLGYQILAYEAVWGIALLIATGWLLFGGENSLRIQESALVSRDEVFIGLGGMLWGGMGGVVGALHALWRYVTSQKFNPQFNIWYLSQPIMGVFIGAFVFLFIKIAFNVTAGSASVEIGSPWMVYLLGFIAGFQQNILYDIVKQVSKSFKLGSDTKNKSTSEKSTE